MDALESDDSAGCGQGIAPAMIQRIWARRDSNPHAEAREPKSRVYTNFTTRPFNSKFKTRMAFKKPLNA